MRSLLAAVALAAAIVFAASGAAAAAVPTSATKVVIIVGATHDATAGYRSNADQAYAEAIKYTSRVTKVYSPNATWAKVKAAVAGANIVIYFGHGNGWPSPYTYDPTYSTKDGMGLNADLNGDGQLSDYENKYYGEPYMAQLGLAPNAIVLLHNLCYASGNSEPGGANPTAIVAHQRIDNYAAGFIKGGARAVIADGHMGPAAYLRALFTTGQRVIDLWRSMPDFHSHEVHFASSRTPGYTDFSDPDTTTSGYYRSLVTIPTLTSTAITNAVGDTGADPASLVVPGRAEVDAPATPLLASTTQSIADASAPDLAEGTRLKTIAIATPATADSPALIQVQGLDDASIVGFVPADHLAPKDSRAPVLLGTDSGTGRFSPNGDGRSDEQAVGALFSESVAWSFQVRNVGGTVVDTATGTGRELDATWDGLVSGVPVPDGTYTWTIRGVDAWANGAATGTGTLVVDTAAPSIRAISPDGSVLATFSPNGDGVSDTVATTATTTESGWLVARVTDASAATVRSFTVAAAAGSNAIAWDGKSNAGTYVPDGDYTIAIAPRDAAGNTGAPAGRPVRVVRMLGFVRNSTKVFYPQDGDRLAGTTTLSFSLSRPATVTWTIRNAANEVVLTHLSAVAATSGAHSWVFDGRLPGGAMLPAGIYASVVTATDGTFTIAQSVKVEMNAFAIAASTATPRRGSRITIVASSAEALSRTPRLYVYQPGLAVWALDMTKIDSRTWKSIITLKWGGTAGTVTFMVWSRDLDGHGQATKRSLTLR